MLTLPVGHSAPSSPHTPTRFIVFVPLPSLLRVSSDLFELNRWPNRLHIAAFPGHAEDLGPTPCT